MLPGEENLSTPELALRFVLSNPSVTVALSGMSTLEQVEQNVETATRGSWLSPGEEERIRLTAEQNQKFMDLYCTGCKYCMPCPQGVNIPRIFEAMNHARVWGLEDAAKKMYREIGTNQWVTGKKADACIECGDCEEKCPQKIPIIEQLKESRRALE
jgi:predicted aldo/keto reductase-like oxidoreductase